MIHSSLIQIVRDTRNSIAVYAVNRCAFDKDAAGLYCGNPMFCSSRCWSVSAAMNSSFEFPYSTNPLHSLVSLTKFLALLYTQSQLVPFVITAKYKCVCVLLTIGTHSCRIPLLPTTTHYRINNVEHWLLFLVCVSWTTWTMPATTMRLLCAYTSLLHTVRRSVCVCNHLDVHSCISCVAAYSGAIRSVFGAFSWRIKPEQQPKQWKAHKAAALQLYLHKDRPGLPNVIHASSALTCGLILACLVDLVAINFHFLVKLLCSLLRAYCCSSWLMLTRCHCRRRCCRCTHCSGVDCSLIAVHKHVYT